MAAIQKSVFATAVSADRISASSLSAGSVSTGSVKTDTIAPPSGKLQIMGRPFVLERPIASSGFVGTGEVTIPQGAVLLPPVSLMPPGIPATDPFTVSAGGLPVGTMFSLIAAGNVATASNNQDLHLNFTVDDGSGPVTVFTFSVDVDTTGGGPSAWQMNGYMTSVEPLGTMRTNTIFTYIRANGNSRGRGIFENFSFDPTKQNKFDITAQWDGSQVGNNNYVVSNIFNTQLLYTPF